MISINCCSQRTQGLKEQIEGDLRRIRKRKFNLKRRNSEELPLLNQKKKLTRDPQRSTMKKRSRMKKGKRSDESNRDRL